MKNSKSLPKIPLRILRWFCHPDLIEDVEGDLSEIYEEQLQNNKIKAKLKIWTEVLLLFRPGIVRNFQPFNNKINYSMLSNYLKIARRNALLYKGYTLLNLLGLITGITSSILIILWLNDEISKDKFHANGDHTYELFRNMKQSQGSTITTQTIPKPVADLMMAEYPEIKQVALLSRFRDAKLGPKDTSSDARGSYANSAFLNMFSFPLILGDQATALDDLNAVVISVSVAQNHFGTDWKTEALGETLLINGAFEAKITGVFEDIGLNSSLRFDWLLSSNLFISENQWVEDWGNGSFYMYVALNSDKEVQAVSQRIRNEINDHISEDTYAGNETLMLHKFQDYYLYSNFDNGVVNGGRIEYVRIMTIVAIALLLIACINFMNLTTARSDRRSKEIGLRKAMGAQKGSIAIQFFTEAFLFSLITVGVSIGLVILLLPYYNQLVDKNLLVNFLNLETWYVIVGLVIGIALLSGSYPAVILPTIGIIQSLKGGIQRNNGSSFIRKGLVIFQFAISTLLIIGTSVIYQQLDYALNKDLGLDKENLLDVRLNVDSLAQLNAYKTELMKIGQVKAVSATSGNPLSYGRSTSSADWEGKDPNEGYEVNIMLTDEEFIATMGMEMQQGRAFSKDFNDTTNFIINEVAAELMGFKDATGKRLSFWGIEGQIIGVVKNYHMRNMHQPIAPLIITCLDPSMSSNIMIRLEGDVSTAINEIEKVTKSIYPTNEFQYRFSDELLESSYQSEQTASILVNIFTVISIIISCLGLFGLSAFTAEQRSKEVGVRKVLGSSVAQIIFMLSKDYAKLIVIAFIIAIPFGYYIMQDWLNNFEYRTILQPQVFLLAGLASLLIGAITISFKSYQAAVVNPVKSLKSE